jgi:hypothetical protein
MSDDSLCLPRVQREGDAGMFYCERPDSWSCSDLFTMFCRTGCPVSGSQKREAGQLSGEKKQTYQDYHMAEGIKYEPEARNLYAFRTDSEVEEIAMFRDGPHKHASPDGVIGIEGMIEIKTVIPSVFVESKLTGNIPTNYRKQMQWGLHISGRKWCDYVIFCPYVKDVDPLLITRLTRNEKEIEELNSGADNFISEMLSMVEAMRK